ncbi:MAG: phosphodiester glycosidase family protein [Clostridiales bacterium]|nr:phosphodiester glycosidase family protein [Clostridiales bacterium]
MKKILSLFFFLLFAFSSAFAQEISPALTVEDITAPSPFSHYPSRNEEGYLPLDQGDKEFVFVDEEEGRWIYLSATMQVEILRYKGVHKKKPIIWYEADIKTNLPFFQVFCASSDTPHKKLLRPEDIALKHQVVYAQNGDFFTYRLKRDKKPGIIIRNNTVLCQKTNKKAGISLPPLDELSLYCDGHFELHTPGTLSADDYLSKGAHDVLSFGPILINDGVIDTRLSENRLYTNREPRSAIGMVSPGHYMGFYIEARNKRSYGCGLPFIAQRMVDQGCQLAINLDGGQTAAMMFMGKPVMKGADYNGYTHTRPQQDIIGIGTSPLVKE